MSSSFWEMGGYATYVWGSVAAFALTLAWNLWAPRSARRKILQTLVEDQTTTEHS